MLLLGQRGTQRLPTGIAQPGGDAQLVLRVAGEGVGLGVAQHLQTVFQPPQEQVGLPQLLAFLLGDLTALHQRGQRMQQAPLAQCRLAAATDELQRLAQELDLADATGAALDVVVHVTPRHLGGDRRLHLAQAIKRGEIQIPPVDERAQRGQPGLAGGDVTGHRARLQPGIAFPVAAFALEVQVHAGEGQRHPAGIAEGAQAQVDPMAEAIDGGVIQQPRQPLAQAREVLLGRQRPRAIGFAAFRVGVDQVHVGTEVELAAAQLAQPEHHQLLRLALRAAHHPMAGGELGFQRGQPQPEAMFGQRGGTGQGLLHGVQCGQITPDEPGRHRRAVAAQLRRPFTGLLGFEQRQRQWRAARLGQVRKQRGLAAQRVQGEIAGDRQLLHEGHQRGVQRLRQHGGKAGKRPLSQWLQGVRQFSVLRAHAALWRGPVQAGRLFSICDRP